MIKPTETPFEQERIKTLKSYSILDTLPEKDYDNITAIAAELCSTPISLVSLLDENRQWFKSHHGLDETETAKEIAFCAHAINDPDNVLVIADSRKDERFKGNPLVSGNPNMIFYAGVPLKAHNGLPLGTLCVIDEKPRQLTEKQIKSLRALSEQVMNLLELRRKKAELEVALKNVRDKNKELERFAFVAAHDISSPLNNISSLAGLFLEESGSKLKQEEKQYIEMIKSSASNLTNLVNGLLNYSRSEQLLKEDFSVIETDDLKKDIERYFYSSEDCKITFKTSLQKIVTNKTALFQILINLLSNAIKYNDKDLAEIEIGIGENDQEFQFYVQDNGPGISEEYHEDVFNIFQVRTAKDKFGNKGTGIGLATVKKLIEALGGHIQLESKPDEGSRFIFNIEKQPQDNPPKIHKDTRPLISQ